jgi:hypothetical protein
MVIRFFGSISQRRDLNQIVINDGDPHRAKCAMVASPGVRGLDAIVHINSFSFACHYREMALLKFALHVDFIFSTCGNGKAKESSQKGRQEGPADRRESV